MNCTTKIKIEQKIERIKSQERTHTRNHSLHFPLPHRPRLVPTPLVGRPLAGQEPCEKVTDMQTVFFSLSFFDSPSFLASVVFKLRRDTKWKK